jgi:hypothetical protein
MLLQSYRFSSSGSFAMLELSRHLRVFGYNTVTAALRGHVVMMLQDALTLATVRVSGSRRWHGGTDTVFHPSWKGSTVDWQSLSLRANLDGVASCAPSVFASSSKSIVSEPPSGPFTSAACAAVQAAWRC